MGNQKGFGADKPLTAEELREYHYKFMMPYFDDVDEIQEFDSYQEGVNTIEAGLKPVVVALRKFIALIFRAKT